MSTPIHTLRPVVTFDPPRMPSGPILAASDASVESDAALALASLLAAHTGASVQIVSVLRPTPNNTYAYDLVPAPLESDVAARQRRESEVRMQVARTQVMGATWPVLVHTGDPSRTLTDHARGMNARVIVTGRGRHHLLGRMLGGELLLRLLQTGETPVFAVEPSLTHLPRRVVIAIDFSEQSLYAAQVALPLVAPDAKITLVHVTPRIREFDAAVRQAAETYQRQVRESLAQLQTSLQRDDLQFESVVLDGKPADALLAFALDAHADLIVSATHGYGFIRRAMLGSVASSLVRGAGCSILCVPGSAHSAAAAYARRVAAGDAFVVPHEMFDSELGMFSRRNARRLCTVEVQTARLGTMTLGHAMPLVGATFDRTTALVALMFGASELWGEHISHDLRDVTGIEIARDSFGRDLSVRFIHGDGETFVELS